MATAVTSKGQVTIPKAVRDLLGITEGTLVDFERAADGRIVLRKVGEETTRFRRLRGHAGAGMSTDEIMALTRDPQ
jgi:antitoxin PrlF